MARAQELVQGCQVCHGVKEAQRGPILDGMEYWYLYDQLQKFRSGVRGQNPQNRSEHLMGIGVKKINNDLEAAYLADWFARQSPKPAVRTVVGDMERGSCFMRLVVLPVMGKSGGQPLARRSCFEPFGRMVLS